MIPGEADCVDYCALIFLLFRHHTTEHCVPSPPRGNFLTSILCARPICLAYGTGTVCMRQLCSGATSKGDHSHKRASRTPPLSLTIGCCCRCPSFKHC